LLDLGVVFFIIVIILLRVSALRHRANCVKRLGVLVAVAVGRDIEVAALGVRASRSW
jgi:hypothetical protein